MIAKKLNMPQGPTSIVIPLKVFSEFDTENGVWYDPQADRALIDALKRTLDKSISVTEVQAHIDNKKFAQAVTAEVLKLTGRLNCSRGFILSTPV